MPLLIKILGNENQLIYLLISFTILGKGIAILIVCVSVFSAQLYIGFGVIYSHRVGFIPRPLHRRSGLRLQHLFLAIFWQYLVTGITGKLLIELRPYFN